MPFSIIRGDITKLETDAIVNAANSKLLAGGGVCGAIFSAAGKEELQKECNRIGSCEIGQAVITKGFKLKAKYVIHTVGPVYGQDPKNEERQLYFCYKNSLELANNKKLRSIAFPVISSGIYGYPKHEAIRIAIAAIRGFLQTNEMDIYLVIYDQFMIDETLYNDVQRFIDERFEHPYKRRPVFDDCTCAASGVGNVSTPMREYSNECVVDKTETPAMFPCTSVEGVAVSKNLSRKKSLEDLMNIKVETFSEMLFRMIDEKGMTDVEVYKRANIDRKLFSKIRKKDYTPKKVTVVALIIALKLNMKDARELLGRAGFAFTQSNKFDVIIQYFIEQQNYDVFEINETLFAFEQQLLGA